MMATEKIVDEVIPEENVEIEPEVDAEGDPVVEGDPEPELDDDDNPIVEEKPACLEEVPESDKPDSTHTMPVAAHIIERDKLKKQRTDVVAENEQLRIENDRLKNSAQTSVGQTLEVPLESDFDTDDEYRAAMRKYQADNRQETVNAVLQSSTHNNQQELQQREMAKAVEDHNIRKDSFIKKEKISEEVYLSADSNIRQAIEAIRPDDANHVYNTLLKVAGDVSEQIWLYVGRSKERLEKFKTTLVNDPTGFSTASLVGEFKKEIKPNRKLISQAPKPAVHISGNTASTVKSKALEKKYDAAKTNQEAFVIRKAAKKQGIDVKEWS